MTEFTQPDLLMNAAQVTEFIAEAFPRAMRFGFVIDTLSPGAIFVSLPIDKRHLRPGGTVSGPTLMTLADTTMYLLVLAHIGPKSLAVTSSLNINFLRKPAPQPLIATARLLKLGRRLAVGDVLIGAQDGPPVAQASVTYALPS